ncbi:3-hydroxyacyl-CoA dehydrogenase [Sulfitobacter sp. SK012]|uniref:SDR family NAD(P)-dependent oxidoreductase n=1 Tax=Sulfitobacter sp. SK012 TaxID=1389005 RepID=UPI000E0AEEF8|nr:SDR family oxidoreductase [Sulfitobacter sp. SK012]AXI47105.1 3-hydroxyacyl-CoA dehydrogenase [Sulfitobacter sp. SK012]
MRQVLITGGGSGIGRATARAFSDAGDAVTITGRREEALRETDGGRGMTCVTGDVTNEADVAAWFAQPFDVVIANAGAGTPTKLRDMSLEQWNDTLSVNLTGTFLTFRAAVQEMQTGGRLIAIASTASLQGGPNISAYVAAKHGVLGLVRALAQEVARSGITCNAVCPGFVDTDMGAAAVDAVSKRFSISADDAEARIVSGNPMRRMIRTEEVVAAVQFLASEGASMVNGHALSVSGGEI